jgi:hypothetical protein
MIQRVSLSTCHHSTLAPAVVSHSVPTSPSPSTKLYMPTERDAGNDQRAVDTTPGSAKITRVRHSDGVGDKLAYVLVDDIVRNVAHSFMDQI